MDDLPINRASNPFKNQGYMLRLARQRGGGMLGRRSSGRRRQRKRQRGGALNAYMAMKSGQKIGRKLDGMIKPLLNSRVEDLKCCKQDNNRSCPLDI